MRLDQTKAPFLMCDNVLRSENETIYLLQSVVKHFLAEAIQEFNNSQLADPRNRENRHWELYFSWL